MTEWARGLVNGTAGPVVEEADYLAEWFLELHDTREYAIIAGMGGGMILPLPVGYSEIQAWAELTESQPTPWEVSTLRRMDKAYMAAKSGKNQHGRKHQSLGEYCQGKEIDVCRQAFGNLLDRVCSTCPN